MSTYLALKLIHILSSTLLFGTGLGTAYFMWRADRTGDAGVIAATARHVVVADWLFTAPAVVVQPLTGWLLARELGLDLTAGWLGWALVLYVLTGACWLPVVKLQIRMRDLAAVAVRDGTALPEDYHRAMRFWFALGWPAFLAVMAIFVLMVSKPDL